MKYLARITLYPGYNFILSENGQMDIIFDLKFSESIKLDLVIQKLDKISDLIKFINKQLNTELIVINKDVLKIGISLTSFSVKIKCIQF